MGRYIDAEKLIAKIRELRSESCISESDEYYEYAKSEIIDIITSLQQEQSEEQPEYGYLSTEYVHGKKSKWNVGDVLAYYICTSNEEGEYPLGKIINVKFDEEDGWVYTFEDGSVWDEQSLFEEEAYKKN